jgi:hypothetical protein
LPRITTDYTDLLFAADYTDYADLLFAMDEANLGKGAGDVRRVSELEGFGRRGVGSWW